MIRPALSLIALSTLVAARLQLQSFNPGFDAAGRQGCISASENADGAPVVIHDCNTEETAKHDWEVSLFTRQNAGPQQIKVFGDKCLDVKDGANTDGTKLQIWTCTPGSTNQLWISVNDFTFNWAGTDKCIDLTDGNIADGNQLQIWTCVGGPGSQNQKWSGNPVPNTEAPATNFVGGAPNPDLPSMCLSAESNTDGAAIALAECRRVTDTFPNGNQTFVYAQRPLSGPIKTYGGSKCLDVPNGDATNGNKLQLWTCVDGSTNQQWKVNSPNTIEWVGKNKCVDITNGNLTAGNTLQIWDCDTNNDNQSWFPSSL
ncbi:hypothetical protein PQX77_005739 [Marasmius sp. AFHP31]|nr:hypothetical protein PQX77_005739 [Marasmius sp. AFHP31]